MESLESYIKVLKHKNEKYLLNHGKELETSQKENAEYEKRVRKLEDLIDSEL